MNSDDHLPLSKIKKCPNCGKTITIERVDQIAYYCDDECLYEYISKIKHDKDLEDEGMFKMAVV